MSDEMHDRTPTARPAPAPSRRAEPVRGWTLAQLKAIVEALVFASPEPLTPKMLFKLLTDEPKEDVLAALDALKADYAAARRPAPGARSPAAIRSPPGRSCTTGCGGCSTSAAPQKLSVAALETLSVVAYRQPVTAAEVNEIRGVNTSGVLSTLLERHLIKIVGRKNVIGRPFLYGTTKEFLIRFGLKDLERSAEDRGHGRRRSASMRRRC